MNKTKIQNILDLKSRGIVYAFLILWVAFFVCNITGLTSFNMGNINSILKEGSLVAIAGIGMTFPIITGRFDLSVASMIAFQGCFLMEMVRNGGLPEILGIILTIILGAACGLFNGLLIAKVKIPAFIATLGMQYTYRALAYIISAAPIGLGSGKEEPIIFTLANKDFLGLPIPFWIMLVCLIVATFILRKTRLGRYTLAIGNSEGASEISGINIDKVILMVYFCCF
ncbi:MAG: ABC transporter permease, partial [Acutalibacter sp.]|nr:ABC transporter permease [Acutalibacter sp.]